MGKKKVPFISLKYFFLKLSQALDHKNKTKRTILVPSFFTTENTGHSKVQDHSKILQELMLKSRFIISDSIKPSDIKKRGRKRSVNKNIDFDYFFDF